MRTIAIVMSVASGVLVILNMIFLNGWLRVRLRELKKMMGDFFDECTSTVREELNQHAARRKFTMREERREGYFLFRVSDELGSLVIELTSYSFETIDAGRIWLKATGHGEFSFRLYEARQAIQFAESAIASWKKENVKLTQEEKA